MMRTLVCMYARPDGACASARVGNGPRLDLRMYVFDSFDPGVCGTWIFILCEAWVSRAGGSRGDGKTDACDWVGEGWRREVVRWDEG